LNPYVYNPAAAASSRAQVFAGYRKQWFGISGAPTVFTLTGSTLVDGSRAGVGIKVSSISRGFLNSTEASLSYAYGVPLNKDSKLFFGLSGGLLSNSVNLSDVSNANDPALGSLSSNLIPSASFGMLLASGSGLNFGVTLPKLITDQQLNSKYSFSYLDNAVVTASFSKWDPNPKVLKKGKGKTLGKYRKTTNIPLELFSIYRYSIYGSTIEATAKYNFNQYIWISAGYRQYGGLIPGIGINANDFSFSYFYEPGIGGDMPLKTHDLLLSLRFGKVNKFRDKPLPTPINKTMPPAQTKAVVKKPETQQVATKPVETKPQTKEVTPPTKQETLVTKPVETPKQENTVVSHKPRMGRTAVTDTAAIAREHEEERRQLDKHIEDHADGKHDDPHNQPVNERHDFVKRGTHHEELDAATYVIGGAFKSRANAEHYSKTLNAMGFKADFGHLSIRNIWYVFIAQEDKIDEAKKERERLRKNKIFSQVWLLTVQE
jgi:type IX secretion system PorP/SprF family membrane protein